MNTQPEALRLADELETMLKHGFSSASATQDAAAELRRLHVLNQELLRSLSWIDQRCPAVLLLKDVHRIHQEAAFDAGVCARAAIAKAEASQQ